MRDSSQLSPLQITSCSRRRTSGDSIVAMCTTSLSVSGSVASAAVTHSANSTVAPVRAQSVPFFDRRMSSTVVAVSG
jgi:hypothetical protein